MEINKCTIWNLIPMSLQIFDNSLILIAIRALITVIRESRHGITYIPSRIQAQPPRCVLTHFVHSGQASPSIACFTTLEAGRVCTDGGRRAAPSLMHDGSVVTDSPQTDKHFQSQRLPGLPGKWRSPNENAYHLTPDILE